jgi:hypothetical protein
MPTEMCIVLLAVYICFKYIVLFVDHKLTNMWYICLMFMLWFTFIEPFVYSFMVISVIILVIVYLYSSTSRKLMVICK